MPSDLRKALQASWVHSHEEDDGEHLVFRGPQTDFPPSRGRVSFTLNGDGSVDAAGPGPDDRRRGSSGRWSLDGKRLQIDSSSFSGTFDVDSADGQRLVLRRVEQEK